MFRKILLAVLVALTVLSLTACVLELDNAGGIVSGALKHYEETVDIGDNYNNDQPVELNLDMKMAKAVIDSTGDKLVEAKFSYSSEALKPELEAEADEISIRNRLDIHNLGKPVNKWDVKLTDKLPFEVELKADASEVKMNMSNMRIRDIDTVLNASLARLYFDEKNREKFEKFKLDADASSADIYGGANIGFEVLDIDADASKIMVDLTGEFERDAEVRIEANASAVKLKLPDDVGIRIVIDNNELSSVRISNDRILSRSKKEYVSKNYEEADMTLKIYADLNVTTLTLE